MRTRLLQRYNPVMQPEASYVCDGCGQEIVVPLDPSAGREQEYVEDCPVCCRPNVLQVIIDPGGVVTVTSRPEQDRY